MPDGTLFVTLGDRGDYPEKAQDLSVTMGKVVRNNPTGSAAREERYLGDLRGRIRDVRQAPDGSLYLLTDSSPRRILRTTPAARR